jgi:hypothetical protein
MFKKVILFLTCLCLLTCTPKYEVVRLQEKYGFYIDNWKQNGVKIISIDTVKTFHGVEYIVRYK